jgi:hypothetical protein
MAQGVRRLPWSTATPPAAGDMRLLGMRVPTRNGSAYRGRPGGDTCRWCTWLLGLVWWDGVGLGSGSHQEDVTTLPVVEDAAAPEDRVVASPLSTVPEEAGRPAFPSRRVASPTLSLSNVCTTSVSDGSGVGVGGGGEEQGFGEESEGGSKHTRYTRMASSVHARPPAAAPCPPQSARLHA